LALLEITDLGKSYGQFAIRDISLSLDRGGILCLLGPSGCGKTTLLRLVAGLERPDEGRIVFDGLEVTDTPPHKRQFGFMFQEFALFPHKSVFDNVAFGPEMQKKSREEIQRRCGEMLELVGLTDLARRNVAALSGGERQRVALARSLAPQPRLLMLDEPLGSLDRALRERLMLEIRAILKKLDMTAVFVTHDQSEALAVADVIAVMNQGRIEQVDPPEDLYLQPKSIFVARFLGFENLLPGRITSDGGVETPLGTFHPPLEEAGVGRGVTLVVRPEGGRLAGEKMENGPPVAEGKVASRLFTGQSYRLRVIMKKGPDLVFDLPNHEPPPPPGQPVRLILQPSKMVVIL
jgi:ABC-type Fe3+/spermidine/putrescine transport system ATPase subunit